ncbi:hypothetical protein ILUMI_09499 [Ignelater luminosus]|uniref:Transposable element P transposase-like C-terminal domain-containing protein n=1 Tax=Ignelater luminosus TaxID=2038154 RepID=A0A8K0GEH0_IGNLU|nr:hypothetical protein ILUMI_09499 [Ignelater luminosus]
MGATNDHPTPLDFMYRLRWYILGKQSASIFTMNKNTEEDVDETCLIQPLEEQINESNVDDDLCISQSLLRCVNTVSDKCNEISKKSVEARPFDEEDLSPTYTFVESGEPEPEMEEFKITPEFESFLEQFERKTFSETISDEGLKYIAGYVAFRFQSKYPDIQLGTHTRNLEANSNKIPDWIEFLSRGHLMYPSDGLLTVTKILNDVFLKVHKNLLSLEPMISLFILSDLSKKHKEELKQPQKADISTTTVLSSDSDIPELLANISLTDDNAIYYVSGYVSKKFLKLHACDECRNILLDKAKLLTGEHQLFTYFK